MGDVFGMQQMDVKPPAAAALEPDSIVSAYSKPGSRRCTCMSMKPGATMRAVASNFSAPVTCSFSPMPAILPFSISTSRMASRRVAGSITRPLRMIRLRMDSISQAPFHHAYSYRDAVLHLIQDHGALRVRSLRRDLAAAINGTRMHYDGMGARERHMFESQSVKPEIFA